MDEVSGRCGGADDQFVFALLHVHVVICMSECGAPFARAHWKKKLISNSIASSTHHASV